MLDPMRHESLLSIVVLGLVGCASSGLASSNQERLALYREHSSPVDTFRITRLQGRQVRWSAIGDQALVVYDDADQPHLLELPQKCSGLATARSVAITNATGVVTPGTDSVQLLGPSKAGSAYFCRIGTARRIDMEAVERARQAAGSPAPR